MQEIQTKGLQNLSDKEREIANNLLNEYYPKIQRRIKNIMALLVNFKEYKKEGKQKKYSINVKVKFPGGIFEINATDWELKRTLHKALNKIQEKIEHRLHSSDQK